MQSACPTTVRQKPASQPTTQRPAAERKSPKPIQKQWVPKVHLEVQGITKVSAKYGFHDVCHKSFLQCQGYMKG